MSTLHPSEAPITDLLTDVQHAHQHARAALDDSGQSPLAAVTWASAHLAAVTRVLHPLACRLLPDGRERVRGLAATDHELELALWELDRRLTGDVQQQHVPVELLVDRVRAAMEAHEREEHALVTALQDALGEQERKDVAEQLSAALLRAPTRPHPDTRHGRFVGGLAFWVDGIVDRVRDSMDSRVVPTPRRVPTPRPMTRWGAYALGAGSSEARRRR